MPVIVAPYVQPFADTAHCDGVLFSRDERQFLSGFVGELDAVIRTAARRHGFFYLSTLPGALRRHHVALCDTAAAGLNVIAPNPQGGTVADRLSPANWTHNSIHPNSIGHQAIADAAEAWFHRHPALHAPRPQPDAHHTVASLASLMGGRVVVQCGEGIECRVTGRHWLFAQVHALYAHTDRPGRDLGARALAPDPPARLDRTAPELDRRPAVPDPVEPHRVVAGAHASDAARIDGPAARRRRDRPRDRRLGERVPHRLQRGAGHRRLRAGPEAGARLPRRHRHRPRALHPRVPRRRVRGGHGHEPHRSRRSYRRAVLRRRLERRGRARARGRGRDRRRRRDAELPRRAGTPPPRRRLPRPHRMDRRRPASPARSSGGSPRLWYC